MEWRYMPAVLALRRLRQKGCWKCKACLGYIARFCIKTKEKNNNQPQIFYKVRNKKALIYTFKHGSTVHNTFLMYKQNITFTTTYSVMYFFWLGVNYVRLCRTLTFSLCYCYYVMTQGPWTVNLITTVRFFCLFLQIITTPIHWPPTIRSANSKLDHLHV